MHESHLIYANHGHKCLSNSQDQWNEELKASGMRIMCEIYAFVGRDAVLVSFFHASCTIFTKYVTCEVTVEVKDLASVPASCASAPCVLADSVSASLWCKNCMARS